MRGARSMDNEQEATSITEASDLFAELRAQVSLEALGQGRLDSAALGVSEGAAALSEEEYLDRSGLYIGPPLRSLLSNRKAPARILMTDAGTVPRVAAVAVSCDNPCQFGATLRATVARSLRWSPRMEG
jgi:hypothetical protein